MPNPTRTLLKPESWPAGHRAALAVFVDLDPEDSPSILPSSVANKASTERLLATLADMDIVPTVIVDADAEAPYRIPPEANVDPAAHIFETPADLSAARAACKERIGASPRGIVLLAGMPTIGMEHQDLWFLDGSGGPFPLKTAKGKVVVPYSVWWHDATWLSTINASPPSALLESWSASLASVRTRGELMTIMLSGPVSGHPGHLETIQRFLDEAIAAGDVWITNGSGIADWVKQKDNG